MHIQNARDFPQTKLDSEINALFLLNEHGGPRFFFEVFAKNSLIKNIFEEKKFDSRRPGLQATGNHGTVRKSATLPQPSNQNGLYEAIMLMSINEAWLSR